MDRAQRFDSVSTEAPTNIAGPDPAVGGSQGKKDGLQRLIFAGTYRSYPVAKGYRVMSSSVEELSTQTRRLIETVIS